MKPQNLIHTLIILILSLGSLPSAYAVSPALDGCYPGFTTAEGCNALSNLTIGIGNTGIGWYSLFFDTYGSYNTGLGAGTLVLNIGNSNTATGAGALLLNDMGTLNCAFGTDELVYNGFGNHNDAFGAFALFNNSNGFSNNAFGNYALFENITSVDNTAIGDLALLYNDETGNGLGNYNTAVGAEALCSNTDGDSNDPVGFLALYENNTGVENLSVTEGDRRQCNSTVRMVAEEVANVNPDLVARDKEGKPCSVHYDQVNAMLLNEFLKEHRRVQKLETALAQQRSDFQMTVAELKKELERVVAHSKEQDGRIEEVSAHVGLNDSVSRVVANNR